MFMPTSENLRSGPDQSVSVGLTPEAKEAWDAICARHGVFKRRALAKLITWFAAQSEDDQFALLGGKPCSLESAAGDLLRSKGEQTEQAREDKKPKRRKGSGE